MKFKFRQLEERPRAKVLFIMLSQFSTTTFSVPVRKFRSPKTVARVAAC